MLITLRTGYLFFERTEDPFTSASLSAMTEEWRKAYHLERGGQKPAELELTPVPCSPLGRHLRIGNEAWGYFSSKIKKKL